MTHSIYKAALLVIRDGRMMLCRRKKGGPLILPGGKLEAGETIEECLVREVAEELGGIKVSGVTLVGTYEDMTPGLEGEPERHIRIDLFDGRLSGEPEASAEIAELVWFGPGDDLDTVAPSLRNKISPDLRKRGLLSA
jgi:ADP-ribose pyrophosphatase YjhB (NUDIX family)